MLEYKYAGRPLGTDITQNPYSVEKQYAKADEIKVDNKFYDLKKLMKLQWLVILKINSIV